MSKPFTSFFNSILRELSAVIEGIKSGSYMLGAYFTSSTSNLLNCASTLLTKLSQFFFSLGDQVHSAMAKALGHVIYCTWRKVYTCSVHKLPCPPKIYFCSLLLMPAG